MAAPTDRIKGSLLAFLDSVIGSRIDYHALYPCTVAGQGAGGGLELLPDDARMRGAGLGDVPIRTGAPGYVYAVPVKSRVLLGFEAGDPSRPYASLWESATGVDTLTFDGGSESVARTNDATNPGSFFMQVDSVSNELIVSYVPAGIVAPIELFRIAPGSFGDFSALPVPMAGLIIEGNDKLQA